MPSLAPGAVVDRYEVERVLGRGGQATVYQVRHRELDVLRALKVLEGHDTVARERLFTEGRLLARLRHPNLVEVVDVLSVEGAPALVMAFVGGGNLQDRADRGRLPLAEVERLFRGVLDGVEAAHDAGVVHRDLKPANVLLDDTEDPPVPRVADFGIARADTEDAGLTGTGVGLGSPAWMAPEQARGARGVDARADIWALGALLYFLLTGHQPFTGDTVTLPVAPVAAAARVGHAVSLPDLDRGWVRRARLRVPDATGAPLWHVAVLAVSALTGAGDPSVEGGTLAVGPLRNATSANSFAVAPAGDVPAIDAEGSLEAARGRLAIVGALSGDADLARTPDGPRYGAEILAVEVQTLLRQAAPRELAPWLAAVLTLTVGLASRRWSRFAPLALALTFALALATGGWLVPLSPLVLAAVAGGWRSATPRAR